MKVTCKQIQKDFPELISGLQGNGDVEISEVTPVRKGQTGTLSFVSNPKDFSIAFEGSSSALVLPAKAWNPEIQKLTGPKTILLSPNVGLAMALIIDRYFNPRNYDSTRKDCIHPSACVDPSAQVSPEAFIDAHVVIGKNVKVGAGTWIGANTVVQDECTIGMRCRIYPLVFIGRGTEIGNDCEIKPNSTVGSEGYGYSHDHLGRHYRIPQRGRVVLEDRVEIGANCGIDRATFEETRICEGTKLDNFNHVGHNCRIGKNGIITAGMILAGSTTIGDNFLTGGGVRITGHIRLSDNVQLASLSAVTNSIEKPGAYGGHPVQALKDYLRSTSSLPFLPQIRRDLKRILKHLGLPEEE